MLEQRALTWGAALTLGFMALDGLLLAALPVLGLSFGPVLVPWSMAALLRVGVLLALWVARLLRRRPRRRPLDLYLAAATHALLTLAAVQMLYVEPQLLPVTRVRVHHPGLRQTVRIAHLTDLHVERVALRERRVLAWLEEEQPDLIALTGDYIGSERGDDATTLQQTRQWLSKLHAPLGVYAVSGNVDSPAVMAALFDGLPIRVLHDEVLTLPTPAGPLALVGIDDDWNLPRQQQELRRLAPSIPAHTPSILLFHKPDLMPEAKEVGITLALAGHTHGGQVRIPGYGALVTFSAYGKRWEGGVYREAGTTLVVSRGLGMEGFDITPRIRFFCPPELVVVELGPE